jgi:uncharacterized membrane protein
VLSAFCDTTSRERDSRSRTISAHSKRLKLLTLLALSWLFISTGFSHLHAPAPFVRIVPHYFPGASTLVALTGVLEIAGGLALLWPRLRRPASIALAVLLLAVFPANINMALNPERFTDIASPTFFWLRLPLQFVYIALTLWSGRPNRVTERA